MGRLIGLDLSEKEARKETCEPLADSVEEIEEEAEEQTEIEEAKPTKKRWW